MRGRTNVTQRSGPVVIGNLVTRKQVTGSRINMGDFVEFTGDTSAWESLSGPFNYQYSKSFEITTLYSGSDVENVIFGVFYVNPTSSQCRLVVCDKNGILKITNLSGISFENVTVIRDIYLNSNKLYVTFNVNASTTRTIDGKVYVFNYNGSNYSITYDRTISVTLPTYSGTTYYYYLIGVRGSYIYGYAKAVNGTYNHHIVRMNMNGSAVVNDYSFTSNDFDGGTYNVFVEGNYMFFFPQTTSPSNSDRIIFNYSNNSVVVQHGVSNDLEGTEYTQYGTLMSSGDYFFLIGNRSSYGNLCVFYLDANMNIHVVNNKGYSVSGANYYVGLIEENSGIYKIIFCHWGSTSSTQSRVYCKLATFDSGNSSITVNSDKNFGNQGVAIFYCENLFLFDASNIYNLFYTRSSDVSNNYLARTKFVINNDTIVQTESLDLVKPYENTINGVAKTGGNIGQEISVYIPS